MDMEIDGRYGKWLGRRKKNSTIWGHIPKALIPPPSLVLSFFKIFLEPVLRQRDDNSENGFNKKKILQGMLSIFYILLIFWRHS